MKNNDDPINIHVNRLKIAENTAQKPDRPRYELKENPNTFKYTYKREYNQKETLIIILFQYAFIIKENKISSWIKNNQ